MNPIISILHNTVKGTYHPIIFLEAPLPGPHNATKPVRHKSKMHHTGGFATRYEAVKNATDDLAPRIAPHYGTARTAFAADIPWDGEGIPAIVAFFAETDEGLKAVL